MLISLEIAPICDATSGAVILFERKNNLPIEGDVGHVGIAFQNPDGTWSAGAIEGPPWWVDAATGVGSGTENGGWARIFKTEQDVINEFSNPRPSASDGIKPHAAYDNYKIIEVDNVDSQHYAQAYQEIMKFNDETGFSVERGNDCLTNAVAVMKAYGANVPDAPMPPNPTLMAIGDALQPVSGSAGPAIWGTKVGAEGYYMAQPTSKPKVYFNNLNAPESSLNAAVGGALARSQQSSQANTQENAAITHCSDKGGEYHEGACIFSDGSSCNAQDFLSGK